MVVRNSGIELAMAFRVAPLIPGGSFLPRKSEATSNPWEERQIIIQLTVIRRSDESHMGTIWLPGLLHHMHELVIQEVILKLHQELLVKAVDPHPGKQAHIAQPFLTKPDGEDIEVELGIPMGDLPGTDDLLQLPAFIQHTEFLHGIE